jgi:hypothetical protein
MTTMDCALAVLLVRGGIVTDARAIPSGITGSDGMLNRVARDPAQITSESVRMQLSVH